MVRRDVAWALVGAALLVVGGLAGALWTERRAAGSGQGKAGTSTPRPDSPRAAQAEEPVEISLTPEAIERAGIKTAQARRAVARSATTVPGTVTSNAYRDTKVNALVGGVVQTVSAELGARVRRGDPLAVVFSSELADAQMKYLSMQAMLDADRQKRERAEKLVALGAASRQELEEVTAVHHARETELAAARQRLLLLGLSPDQVAPLRGASQIVSEVTVRAPADGVVIGRSVNPGQVVGAGQELFVVTDLATVWVIADLYEQDFAAVRVGTEVTIASSAAPDARFRGRVAYIDPRVDPATRTAKVRIEVPNPRMDLRLGMFVSVSFETGSGERRTVVPRSAVQTLGERTVVYVPLDEGRFSERAVKLGASAGDAVEVLEGLKPGEKVVTEGSFLLRAEAARTRSGG